MFRYSFIQAQFHLMLRSYIHTYIHILQVKMLLLIIKCARHCFGLKLGLGIYKRIHGRTWHTPFLGVYDSDNKHDKNKNKRLKTCYIKLYILHISYHDFYDRTSLKYVVVVLYINIYTARYWLH